MKSRRFAFSRSSLRELPTNGDRTCYYDTKQSGLVLEVSGETKSFRVYKKFKGRPLKITLGHFDPDMPESRDIPEGTKPIELLRYKPAVNVVMARKMAVSVLSDLGEGVNPAESRARKGMTLGELFTHYRTHLLKHGKKTVPGVTWYWERYLGKLPDEPRKKHGQERAKAPGAVNWEHRSISDVSREEVTRLRFNLSEKVGPTTANRVIELLRAMFNFAKREGLYKGENPAESAGKFTLKSRDRFLRAEESERFFAAIYAEIDQDFADYVLLSLYTGARRGNILRMRWDEVSLEGSVWLIPGDKIKNQEPLPVPLIQESLEILRRRSDTVNATEWVFPGNTAEGHAGPFRAQWERFITTAKLKNFRVHDLRRSLGSWMASSGATSVLTMRALGHKTINAALIYQRLALDPVRNAMQEAVSAMSKSKATK
jgi:integrase